MDLSHTLSLDSSEEEPPEEKPLQADLDVPEPEPKHCRKSKGCRDHWDPMPPELAGWNMELAHDGTYIRCLHGRCALKKTGHTELKCMAQFRFRFLKLQSHIKFCHTDLEEDALG